MFELEEAEPMPLVPLSRIADARSGDKGEGSNVGVHRALATPPTRS